MVQVLCIIVLKAIIAFVMFVRADGTAADFQRQLFEHKVRCVSRLNESVLLSSLPRFGMCSIHCFSIWCPHRSTVFTIT